MLKNTGCVHALSAFKDDSKIFISKGGKVYCAFLDASKAFDNVLLSGILSPMLFSI